MDEASLKVNKILNICFRLTSIFFNVSFTTNKIEAFDGKMYNC